MASVTVTPLTSTGGPATFLLVSPARMPVLVPSMVPLEMTRSLPRFRGLFHARLSFNRRVSDKGAGRASPRHHLAPVQTLTCGLPQVGATLVILSGRECSFACEGGGL